MIKSYQIESTTTLLLCREPFFFFNQLTILVQYLNFIIYLLKEHIAQRRIQRIVVKFLLSGRVKASPG